MKTDLSRFNNTWYSPGASKARITFWLLINGLFLRNPLSLASGFKVWLLRSFGARIGKSVIIKPGVNIKYPWHLEIGDNCWIGENVWIDNLINVTLEDNVCVSQGALLLTGNHDYKKTSFDLITGEIKLEEGVWIGAMAVVTPGVQCKSHSVLTAGSVATTNLKPYTIYQGNPAVPIRKREFVE